MVQQRRQGGSAGGIDVRATRNVILTVVSRLYMMVIETAGHGDVVHYGERMGDGRAGLR